MLFNTNSLHSLFLSAVKKTTIGGQALLEGLMMVGPQKTTMAFRRKNGNIHLEDAPVIRKDGLGKIPILRGAVNLFRQLMVGQRALLRSAALIEEDDRLAKTEMPSEKVTESAFVEERMLDVPDNDTVKPPVVMNRQDNTTVQPAEVSKTPEAVKKTDWVLIGSAMFGILAGVAMFVLLPNLIVSLLVKYVFGGAQTGPRLWYNVLEGLLRLVILLGYMYLTGFVKEINRVWMYHGAEHKTIACYEAGEALTVENVRRYSRFHPRCGTSFLFLMVFVSVLLFSLVGWYGVWLNLLIRLVLVPLLAGISYELLRFSGKYDGFCLGRWISRPGLWVQRLTTKEPDDAILEVAIAAMQAVIPEDQEADAWA